MRLAVLAVVAAAIPLVSPSVALTVGLGGILIAVVSSGRRR